MTCSRRTKLTNVSKGQALGRMSSMEMRGSGSWAFVKKGVNYKIPNPDNYEKCMSFNALFCYKCMEEIKVGDDYYRIFKHSYYPKYYHSSCYDRMHY